MAVYTDVPAQALQQFLSRYDTGQLVSVKGIAEGVSNSNFLVETETARYILTLYEHRIDLLDLPWFLELMEYLADHGQPVPRPIRDCDGEALQELQGKAACLIQFLPGFSVLQPTLDQTRAAGRALASLHLNGAGFASTRPNALGRAHWQEVADQLGQRLDEIAPGLAATVAHSLQTVHQHWPVDLPCGVIHADLFPDNVLMLGDKVTGLIDFYFACTDILAYDLAILHAAWCFPADGCAPLPGYGEALLNGYSSLRPLSDAEQAAWPVLAQGACLRFLLSRAEDWLKPPSAALVQRKDPLPFLRRLQYHIRQHG